MESFLKMLNTQLVLFIYLCIGYYCSKKSIMDDHTKQKLTDLILKITLPCMIFNSFNKPLTPDVLKETAVVFFVAMVIAVVSFLSGKVLYNHFSHEKKSILQYSTLVNNSGFLGMPMVSSVYGTEGLFYASIFIIPNRIFMWTAGLSLFTQSDFRSKFKNIFLNPCIIVVILGILRQIFLIPIPEFLDTAIGEIGNVTTPLSMFVIGAMMVGVSIPSLLEGSIFYLSFIRLIALPLTALALMRLCHMQELLTGISLILTGMPAGTTSVLLSMKYGVDADFASRCVVTTTLLSMITVPILLLFI